MNNRAADSMLGLARRAGAAESGLFLTQEAIRGGKALLVILAEDAKKNTVKQVMDKCRSYHVPLRVYGTAEGLGHALGQEERSCLAITKSGFADKLSDLLEERNPVG